LGKIKVKLFNSRETVHPVRTPNRFEGETERLLFGAPPPEKEKRKTPTSGAKRLKKFGTFSGATWLN